MTVSATVVEALTVEKASDLEFGSVARGAAKTVTKSDSGAGKFIITGEPGTIVSITYSVVTELTDEASNTLPYTQQVAANSTDEGASAVDLTAGSGQVALSEQGRGYVFFGGSLNALADQALGTYSASVEVSVDYP